MSEQDADDEPLTVERFIEDLQRFDKNARVSVGVRRLEMAIPIVGLFQGNADGVDVALIMLDPYQVKAAFDFASQADRDAAAGTFAKNSVIQLLN